MTAFKTLVLFLLLSLLSLKLEAQQVLLQTPYQPQKMRASVQYYLDDLSTRYKIPVSYSEDLVRRKRMVRLRGTEQTVEELLLAVLQGRGLTALERGGKILIVPVESSTTSATSEPVSLSGFVRDSMSKEVLVGAIVFLPELSIGTQTNTFGYYSLQVPVGNWRVISSSLGYRADTSRLSLNANVRRDLQLSIGQALSGVTVSSQRKGADDHQQLSARSIAAHAGLLGENDVMRALQTQPGVQSGPDGSVTVLVRGGDPGQNLNLLDGVPLYYIDHFFGLASIFNTDAVKSVDFYKGAFPSRYGGRLSSIIDVTSRDGNMERISGQGSLGLLKGNLTLEGPIVKNKASVMVSGRRTWIDALWRPFVDNFKMDFYDVNAKVNWIANKNNRFYASFYTGRDQFRLNFEESDTRIRWGNTIGSARWTSVLTPRFFLNTTATYSYFRYQLSDRQSNGHLDSNAVATSYTGNSNINDLAIRSQADYYASPRQHVQVGLLYSSAWFLPADVSYNNSFNSISSATFRSNEVMLYAEDELRFSDQWLLRAGIHLATWTSERFNYVSPQPRLFLSWQPRAAHRFYASATRMSQFLHLVSSNTSLTTADFWLPSTSKIAPEQSWLMALGYSGRHKNRLEYSAEVFYKDLQHLVTYKSDEGIFENSLHWEEQLVTGRGRAYGAEFSGAAHIGPLSLSAAYTLSWAFRQFDALNGGKEFPFRYDRRHNLRTELVFQRKRRFNAVASWTYMSGEAITLPDQAYPDYDNVILNTPGRTPSFTYHFVARNNYRLPAIHRLDVSLNFIKARGRHFERTWTLGMYNAYGRPNVMGVYLDNNGSYELRALSIFRFIPSVSYSVKF